MNDDITNEFIELLYKGKLNRPLLIKYIAKFILYLSIFAIIALGASVIFLWGSRGLSSIWALLAFSLLLLIVSLIFLVIFNDEHIDTKEFERKIKDAFETFDIRKKSKKDLMIKIIEKEIDAGNMLVQNLSNTLFSVSLTVGVSLLSSWLSDYILRENGLNNDVMYYIFAIGISFVVFSIVLAIYFSITSVWSVEKKKRLVFFYYKNQLTK